MLEPTMHVQNFTCFYLRILRSTWNLALLAAIGSKELLLTIVVTAGHLPWDRERAHSTAVQPSATVHLLGS